MHDDELDQLYAEFGGGEDTEIPEASESGTNNKAFLADPPEDETSSKKTKHSAPTPEMPTPTKGKKNKGKKGK